MAFRTYAPLPLQASRLHVKVELEFYSAVLQLGIPVVHTSNSNNIIGLVAVAFCMISRFPSTNAGAYRSAAGHRTDWLRMRLSGKRVVSFLA